MTIFLCFLAYTGFLCLVLYAQHKGGRFGEVFGLSDELPRPATSPHTTDATDR